MIGWRVSWAYVIQDYWRIYWLGQSAKLLLLVPNSSKSQLGLDPKAIQIFKTEDPNHTIREGEMPLPIITQQIPRTNTATNERAKKGNDFDAGCGLRKIRAGHDGCCCCCVCVVCGLQQSWGGWQSTLPGRIVRCVRGTCCAVCMLRGHTPQSPKQYS